MRGARSESGRWPISASCPRPWSIDYACCCRAAPSLHGRRRCSRCRRSLPHGHVAAVIGMMRKLDLPRLLGRSISRERDLALALIASRIVEPGSKLATARALSPETASSSLGRVLELGVIEERGIYAALDWLSRPQQTTDRTGAGTPASQERRPGVVQCFVVLRRRPVLRARPARLQPRSPAGSAADRLRPAMRSRWPADRRRGIRRRRWGSQHPFCPDHQVEQRVNSSSTWCWSATGA